jgi:branched-subunit amino acid aminotransferase/4-amino-4-deoxychorismate lyase
MELVLHNRSILPKDQVLVSLDSIDVAYGYGVYETMKVRKGVVYYPEFHEQRLFDSARFLGIHHDFQPGEVIQGIRSLLVAWKTGGSGDGVSGSDRGSDNMVEIPSSHVPASEPSDSNHYSLRDRAENCNLKVLMIGHTGKPADLYCFILGPLYPDRKELKKGASALIYPGERHFPQAKSLSMLMSTIAFRSAQGLGCYDSLLMNRHHQITEGTRTNLFFYYGDSENLKELKIFTPPLTQVLNGITRRTIWDCFLSHGIQLEEKPLSLADLLQDQPPALFLSSTSTKIMPIKELQLPWSPEIAGSTNTLGTKEHLDYLDRIGITEPADVQLTQSVDLPVPKSMRFLQEIYNDYLERWAEKQ